MPGSTALVHVFHSRYDLYGNLTSKAESASTLTAMTYDAAGRLTAITPASGTSATFTLDALGRHRTRVLSSGGTDTYSYLGTSETVHESSNTVTGTTRSLLDPGGTRLAVKTGAGAASWTLFDHLGSLIGLVNGTRTITDARRYDGYGETVASVGSTVNPWRFRGNLDVSPTGDPLYEMGARYYAPSLGAFTQVDTYAGSAANPASMNRFLYAEANPATLIDPTGHEPVCSSGPACLSPAEYAELKAKQKSKQAGTSGSRATSSPAYPLSTAWKRPTPAPQVTSVGMTPAWTDTRGGDYQHVRAGPSLWDDMVSHPDEYIVNVGSMFGTAAACAFTGGLGCFVGAVALGPAPTAYEYTQGRATIEDVGRSVVLSAAFAAGGMAVSRAVPAVVGALRGPVISRLPRDVAVNGQPAPPALSTSRSIGSSPTQNAELQAEIARRQAQRATDIRVNQTQVDIFGRRVGVNRPDLQYTLNGQRHYVEYDVPGSTRGIPHVVRIQANDPLGLAYPLTVP